MGNPADAPAGADPWSRLASNYAAYEPPMLPGESDVATIREAISGCDGRVVLLGVTPKLSSLGRTLIAVDGSARMIERIWPGNDERRCAFLGEWLNLPIATAGADAVIGDGSLSAFIGDLSVLLREIRRILRPGGVAAFRAFCSSDRAESLAAIKDDVLGGWRGNFCALRWRIAMALAAGSADYTVLAARISVVFNELFPDRRAFCDITGWSEAGLATMDAAAGTHYRLCFMPASRLVQIARAVFANVELVPAQGYALAERCPAIVMSGTATSSS